MKREYCGRATLKIPKRSKRFEERTDIRHDGTMTKVSFNGGLLTILVQQRQNQRNKQSKRCDDKFFKRRSAHLDHQQVPQTDLRGVVHDILFGDTSVRYCELDGGAVRRTSLYWRYPFGSWTSTAGPLGMWQPRSSGWFSAAPASCQSPGCERPKPFVALRHNQQCGSSPQEGEADRAPAALQSASAL